MNLRDLIAERAKLEGELRDIVSEEEAAERKRHKRKTRHLQVVQRLAYISAVERMLESLPDFDVEGDAATRPVESASAKRTTRRRLTPHLRSAQTYGKGIGTIRKVLSASTRDLSPREIRAIAASEHGVSLNAGSVRGALRRMTEKTGEAVRKGDKYGYARTELPLERNEGHETEKRSDRQPDRFS